MDVINEILQKSALGVLSNAYKSLVLLLFSAIVTTLLTMLVLLITYGSHITVQFGY
ncbi:hypothetical protein [Maribacter sp. MJ134]|uniref:hypothetical protein n=1 Tax=Maribacter sp. MJ134 TaxID=2496865 RepID=UPI0013DFA837|nr:hypothetical protein [Maribacter sp. MJ134]